MLIALRGLLQIEAEIYKILTNTMKSEETVDRKHF
jgi:hypothetical protein